MPAGLYEPEELLVRIITKGCKASMWALNVMYYRITYGRRWEEWILSRDGDLLAEKQRLGYLPLFDANCTIARSVAELRH